MEEIIDVLDKYGQLTGETTPKSIAHRDGIWHRTVHIWIQNHDGDILLQRRAYVKPSHPGYWDISAAGHISAGEDARTSGVRELNEELGISVSPDELKQLFVHRSETRPRPDWINNEFNYVFLLRWKGNPDDLQLQEEEVAEVRWLSLSEFKILIKSTDPKNLIVPHEYFPELLEALYPTD